MQNDNASSKEIIDFLKNLVISVSFFFGLVAIFSLLYHIVGAIFALVIMLAAAVLLRRFGKKIKQNMTYVVCAIGLCGILYATVSRIFFPDKEKKAEITEDEKAVAEKKVEAENFFNALKIAVAFYNLRENDPIFNFGFSKMFADYFAQRLKSGANIPDTIKELEQFRVGKSFPNCSKETYNVAIRLPACELLKDIYSGKYGDACKDAEKNEIVCKHAAEIKTDAIKMAMTSKDSKTIFQCALIFLNNESDFQQGVEFLHKASELGETEATFLLGELFLKAGNMPQALLHYRTCGNDHKQAIEALNNYKIANTPPSLNNVKLAYIPQEIAADGKEKLPKMEFRKDGKCLFAIESKVQNLCFAEEVRADSKNNKIRLTFTPYNFEGKDFDWRTKLLDLKGDGDFRYLIIADYHTGSAADDMKGYVIDVKDSFKRIATIPIGEAFDLPCANPGLDFKSR